MKPWQTLVRYGAIAFAVILIVNLAVWSLSAFGFIFHLSSGGTSEEAEDYVFDADIDRLELDISAARLVIRIEKCESVTVKSNLKRLTAKENSGKLKVKDNKGLITVTQSDAYIEVIIPDDATLREIELDLGAGETLLSSIRADKVDIDGGAGELILRRCTINELDLDMGVGELDFHGSITDKADIDLGVGNAQITLLGKKDDYKLKLNKGIGEITVDGTKVGNSVIGDGDLSVEIDGGIGNISVSFADTDE